jgi:NADH dehydrogenase
MNDKTVCVLGGTGFVGRHLTSRLADEGYRVTVPSRRPQRHRDMLVLPTLRLVQADIHDMDQLRTHLQGCDVAVNLVGILNEKGHKGEGFRHAHVELARKLMQACAETGVARLLHMSALNADAASGPSLYLRTKGEAENLVLTFSGGLTQATSFRPSVIFGPGDSFLNRFAQLLKWPPLAFPLACPNTRFAPVYVGDVVERFVGAIDERSAFGKRYDLCGPREYTLKQLVQYVARLSGRRRWIIGLPDWASRLQAAILEYMPGKPFSLDNYRSLTQHSVCHGKERCPASLESIAPGYLGDRDRWSRLQRLRESY